MMNTRPHSLKTNSSSLIPEKTISMFKKSNIPKSINLYDSNSNKTSNKSNKSFSMNIVNSNEEEFIEKLLNKETISNHSISNSNSYSQIFSEKTKCNTNNIDQSNKDLNNKNEDANLEINNKESLNFNDCLLFHNYDLHAINIKDNEEENKNKSESFSFSFDLEDLKLDEKIISNLGINKEDIKKLDFQTENKVKIREENKDERAKDSINCNNNNSNKYKNNSFESYKGKIKSLAESQLGSRKLQKLIQNRMQIQCLI